MRPTRTATVLMLLPTLIIIGVLFGGSILYSLLQSLGWQPVIGRTRIEADAYANILLGEYYAPQFWQGLLFTAWLAAASTLASAALAVAAALLLRRTFAGKRVSTFLLQFSLPIPHLVAAVGMLFLLSQSGLLARIGAHLGVIGSPSEFPILVRDGCGIGIIVAYLWKEVPFVGLILLATLQALGDDYEDAARTLGARPWQRFRHVTLPLIRPALVSSSLIVFAFVFGAYEIPGVLGVRYPKALPVLAYQMFISPDLNDRASGMALSLIISLIVMGVVTATMLIDKRQASR